MKKTILVLIPVKDSHKKFLEAKAPFAKFIYTRPSMLTKEEIEKAHIIIGNPPIDFLKYAKHLEWLQLQTAGSDTYAKEEVINSNILLTNSTGAYGLAIAEHMIGMILMLYKNFHLYKAQQTQEVWRYLGEVKSIAGSKTLIVGAGDIGGEFAKRMKALGSYTIGIRRTQVEKPGYLDEIHFMKDLESILPQVDIVALSLPHTPETCNLINKKRLHLMKKDAILLNVGRGSSVDTEALCDALEANTLLGAGLDVTNPEPLPQGHRLWKLNNVILTPHVSGGYSLPETLNRIVTIAGENLEAFLEAKPLKNIVDFKTGYRKL